MLPPGNRPAGWSKIGSQVKLWRTLPKSGGGLGAQVILAELRPIIDQRPTYGYRRVTALLNRQRRKEGKASVNTKRVLGDGIAAHPHP